MKRLPKLLSILAVPLMALQLNCSASGDDANCEGAKCDDNDDIEVSPCDALTNDRSGRNLQGSIPGRFGDPLAMLVLRAGDTCPTSFSDVMAKLRETDAEGCTDERSGIGTMVVSETSQILGEADSYRLVTTRACNNRKREDLMFSLFGVGANAKQLPEDVEVMAFDESKGIYNYYTLEGGEWNYFGDSHDMLSGPGEGGDKRCANCHTGGGLVMKELHTPWLHWEGHMDTPGAQTLVTNNPDLGTKSSGSTMESLVKAGNRKWNTTRVAMLQETGTVKDLLRPLFCTVEINVDNGADFESPPTGEAGGSEMSRIPRDFLLDPALGGFGSVTVEFSDYQNLLTANNQRVADFSGRAMQNKDGETLVDTVFDFVFPERAEADMDYVNKLKDAGVIDEDFIKDVLMVDFTRPIFSSTRCDLLELAPDMDAADANPTSLREGFIANLEATSPSAGSIKGVFLSHLQNTDDSGDHSSRVSAFVDACKARDSGEFLTDAMRVVSLTRNEARQLHVFEFAASMPVDDQNVASGTRFHPDTCELTTRFSN